MTPDEFAQHLAAQPWAFNYITNLAASKTSFQRPLYNYLGSAFSWSDTPEGIRYWSALRTDKYDVPDCYFISDLFSALPTYFPNNPELFI